MEVNKTKSTQLKDQYPIDNDIVRFDSRRILARRPIIGLFLFFFGSLLFGGLAYNLYTHGPLIAWDQLIANTLPAIALKGPKFLKGLMDAGFYIGDQVIIGISILLCIYFIFKRYWTELTMVVIGIPGSSALFLLLSRLIGRARPTNQIWIVENIPGFPSGHAITVIAFYGLVAYLLVPKIRSTFLKAVVIFLAIFIILFVGFSRVFTGGHYMTDVLAGYGVGIAWSGLAYTLIELIFKKRKVQNVKKE